MPARLLTNGRDNVCLVEQGSTPSFFLYKLEGRKPYGFNFYGHHVFQMALDSSLPILDQEFGSLGSSVDLTGRMSSITFSTGERRIVCHSGTKVEHINVPKYTLMGEFGYADLSDVLKGFKPVIEDIPYASITLSSTAFADSGDDLYTKTLFFMTGGYGLLTDISIVAGRDLDDCCSPEYYFKSSKEKIDGANPLKIWGEKDVFVGAVIFDWTLSATPKIFPEINLVGNSFDELSGLEEKMNELFFAFLPSHSVF